MKVYVVKNNNGEYITELDWFESKEICFAKIFEKPKFAKNQCIKSNGKIVECELIETTELFDHTKQVRKEVLDELCDMLTDRAELIRTGDIAEFMFTIYDLKESIKQIQGETNNS